MLIESERLIYLTPASHKRSFKYYKMSRRSVIKDNCPREAHTSARLLFCSRYLDINPMTLKLESDLDILQLHLHIENEVARVKHSKLLTMDEICMFTLQVK